MDDDARALKCDSIFAWADLQFPADVQLFGIALLDFWQAD